MKAVLALLISVLYTGLVLTQHTSDFTNCEASSFGSAKRGHQCCAYFCAEIFQADMIRTRPGKRLNYKALHEGVVEVGQDVDTVELDESSSSDSDNTSLADSNAPDCDEHCTSVDSETETGGHDGGETAVTDENYDTCNTESDDDDELARADNELEKLRMKLKRENKRVLLAKKQTEINRLQRELTKLKLRREGETEGSQHSNSRKNSAKKEHKTEQKNIKKLGKAL